jgi:hypothetical protein
MGCTQRCNDNCRDACNGSSGDATALGDMEDLQAELAALRARQKTVEQAIISRTGHSELTPTPVGTGTSSAVPQIACSSRLR